MQTQRPNHWTILPPPDSSYKFLFYFVENVPWFRNRCSVAFFALLYNAFMNWLQVLLKRVAESKLYILVACKGGEITSTYT